MRLRAAYLLALTALSGCTRARAPAAEAKHAQVASCNYDVTVRPGRPLGLDVDARCGGANIGGFIASERASIPHFSQVRGADGGALVHHGARWALPHVTPDAHIRYHLDLDSIATDAQDFDVAERVGDSLVAPVSTWILRPDPLPDAAPVTIAVHTPPHTRFISGLTPAGPVYRLETQEIRVGAYSVFGNFDLARFELPGPGALSRGTHATTEITVATLDAPFDPSHALVTRWVRDSAMAVARFWGGFPVKHALVIVMPTKGRASVVFGKLLPDSSPAIVVRVGQHADCESLYKDWVLVHELFHTGSPSYLGEGKWFDEGLATYYEPLIRARAGWLDERDVWREFAHAMPEGLPSLASKGLDSARSYKGIYWGGAIMVLLADMQMRQASGGRRGLEDGMRAVLGDGGDATRVWGLSRTLRTADNAVGTRVLERLAAEHAHRADPVALDKVLRRLGVIRHGRNIELDNSAPLAKIRQQMIFGGHPTPKPVDRCSDGAR